MHVIRHPRDFWAGVLFIFIGGSACLIALDYAMGTAGRMGPGYFPRTLGIMLALIGAGLVVRSFRLSGPRVELPTYKPLIIVLISVLVFGLIVSTTGLVIATVVLVLVASTASHEYRWKESIIAALALGVFVVIAFVYGLSLQLPTWPPALVG
jgi:hypothetical protein